MVSIGGLAEVGPLGGETVVRSGSQLLEMFNMGQQQAIIQLQTCSTPVSEPQRQDRCRAKVLQGTYP